MVDIKKLKQKAIRNVITSDFEIEEGLKIAFKEGYNEGSRKIKDKLNKFIKKIESNWYYCEQKAIYGNGIIDFIDDISIDLRSIK